MTKFLLDTNVISQLVRNPTGPLLDRIIEVGGFAAVCTSIIAASEVRFGAEKKGAPRLAAQIEAVLGALTVHPFLEPADRNYAALRNALERIGRQIGANNMLIAAHALALDCVLVTDNVREFERVPDLRVENWLG